MNIFMIFININDSVITNLTNKFHHSKSTMIWGKGKSTLKQQNQHKISNIKIALKYIQ